MTPTDNATERPFHVRTDPGGVFHSGYDAKKAATAMAQLTNDRASKLGIATRYIVFVKPPKES